MRPRWLLVATVMGLLIAAAGGTWLLWQANGTKVSDIAGSSQGEVNEQGLEKSQPAIVGIPVESPAVKPAVPGSNQSAKAPIPPIAAPEPAKSKSTSQAAPPGAAGKPAPKDPLARLALSFVGADPEAEAYWLNSINNPQLSENERQNLIEDLNEDGLSDPDHPALQDLPLILSRLTLIEQVGPFAMDKVNSDAFAEAYKDLTQMAGSLLGGGGSGR